MKLSNLIIIFIIIIIPVILVFLYYLGLQADTIRMQTDYDAKLIEATKEAVESFEINTVEWKQGDYNTLQNLKRAQLDSTTETFLLSLANKLGIGGSSKEFMLNYIPAIVYVLYDGYYIYSPTHVPKNYIDDNGLQIYYYSDSKFSTQSSLIINSETVAGKPVYEAEESKGKSGTFEWGNEPEQSKSLYYTLDINNAKKEYKHVLKTYVPYSDNEIYLDKDNNKYIINYSLDNYIRVFGKSEGESKEGYIYNEGVITGVTHNNISGIKYNGVNIWAENLTEKIAVKNPTDGTVDISEYPYIYVTSTDKRYFDESIGKFFELNSNNEKNFEIDEYKKLLVLSDTNSAEYIELYQSLNGGDTWYCKNSQGEYVQYTGNVSGLTNIDKNQDCSAINYCIENYCFNKWLKEKEIQIDITNRKDKIIENINNNLNLAISNYSYNSTLNYKIPELSSEDWDQALSNISMITFFQGAKIGLKTYNNYAVVTSTENNEYVSENSLYFITNSITDKYYHKFGCKQIPQAPIGAYRNIDFKVKKYNSQAYYYKHGANMQCFDCIVNQNNFEHQNNMYEPIYYNALARERYIQSQRIRVI